MVGNVSTSSGYQRTSYTSRMIKDYILDIVICIVGLTKPILLPVDRRSMNNC